MDGARDKFDSPAQGVGVMGRRDDSKVDEQALLTPSLLVGIPHILACTDLSDRQSGSGFSPLRANDVWENRRDAIYFGI